MNSLEPLRDSELRALVEKERILAGQTRDLEEGYAGLRDLDLSLELIAVRLRIAVTLLERGHLGGGSGAGVAESSATSTTRDRSISGIGSNSVRESVRGRAEAAVSALEELRLTNVSAEQKGDLLDTSRYPEVRQLLERFVALGGGALLEQREHNERRRHAVTRAAVEAVSKFVAPEDGYAQLFKSEQLPPWLRRLVGFFLPVLAREHQQDPPYGIEEGQEVLLTSERMKMPLSQAVYYLETEVLPQLDAELAANPGDPLLQHRRKIMIDKLREYRSVHLVPRATPLNLEKGFYTDWLSNFTADGELLVTIELPVQMLSGTNLERLKGYVQEEVVRRLAGKGVCPELDADYRFRKSLDSGRRGSSRVPSSKLDFQRGFRVLRAGFPVLRYLDDRTMLQHLVALVRSEGSRKASKFLVEQVRDDRVGGLLDRSLGPPADDSEPGGRS